MVKLQLNAVGSGRGAAPAQSNYTFPEEERAIMSKEEGGCVRELILARVDNFPACLETHCSEYKNYLRKGIVCN